MGIKWQSPKKHLRALKMSYRKHNRKLHHYSLLLYPPAVCKFGGMSNLYLINIECRWCDLTFCICRSCWRGQAYCCNICRLAGRLKNCREAQRKYRKTDKGKKNTPDSDQRQVTFGVILVFISKFFCKMILLHKCLEDPDTGDGLLRHSAQIGKTLLNPLESSSHLPPKGNNEECDEWQRRYRYQG